jgi:DNA repair protein RecO (recombination protein O)
MVPSHNTPAILLRRLVYGETSFILTWFTARHGRIKTMVKGARKPGGKFNGQFDLFYQCDIQYRPARRGEIHFLTESRLLHPFLALRREWTILQCAHYFGELLELLSEADTPLPDDYGLFEKALKYLETHPASREVIFRFEKRLLGLHGLRLDKPEQFSTVLKIHQHRQPKGRETLLQALPH